MTFETLIRVALEGLVLQSIRNTDNTSMPPKLGVPTYDDVYQHDLLTFSKYQRVITIFDVSSSATDDNHDNDGPLQ